MDNYLITREYRSIYNYRKLQEIKHKANFIPELFIVNYQLSIISTGFYD